MKDLLETYRARYRRAKGFTLVELLIVIMIIAILAGMLLLATGSSTETAEAARLINDIRNLKSAAMLWGLEHGIDPGGLAEYIQNNDANAWITDIFAYMDRSTLQYENGAGTATSMLPFPPTKLKITIDGVTEERTFVGFAFWNTGYAPGISDGVKEKLTQQAQKVGLYGISGGDSAAYYSKNTDDGGNYVLMMLE